MLWLLLGYMFLFIHRPFEVWPILGEIHFERIYMAVMLLVWTCQPKRWLPNLQHWSYALFASVILICWCLSPWMDTGQTVVENWFKIVVFYLMLVTTVRDEKSLRLVTLGFLAVMGLYMAHSLKEFAAGRHTFRMGIVRLIGVDTSLGDPNSFGNSVLFAMPFVTAFWQSSRSRLLRLALVGYLAISAGCILLTGSRSSFIGMCLWVAIVILRSRFRWAGVAAAIVCAPVIFLALPESLQNRFETIIHPEVGPANAQVSGEGRIEGFLFGIDLLFRNPLSGCGPGAWRPATGSEIESHNLYGQVMGETGSLGIIAFGFILFCFWRNLSWINRNRKRLYDGKQSFPVLIAGAVGMGKCSRRTSWRRG